MVETKALPRLFDLGAMTPQRAFGNGMTGEDVISVDQFNREKLAYIFERA
jgi:hypothetical protein